MSLASLCPTGRTSVLWVGVIAAALTGCNSMSGAVQNTAGRAHYRQGNYTQARDDFQRAVANNPYNADYLHNLATAMKKQGDLSAAEQTYVRALQMNPEHQPSYHSLAMLMKEQNRLDDANRLVQGWADTQPYSEAANIELGWIRREQGDITGAEAALVQALRINPRNHNAANQLAEVYEKSGQTDRAIAMYNRSLATRAHQPQVQSRMATIRRSNPGAGGDPMLAMLGPGNGTIPTTTFAGMPNTQAQSVQAFGIPTYQSATVQTFPTYQSAGAMPTFMAPPTITTLRQPVNLGDPVTSADADPAHADSKLRTSEVPVEPPH